MVEERRSELKINGIPACTTLVDVDFVAGMRTERKVAEILTGYEYALMPGGMLIQKPYVSSATILPDGTPLHSKKTTII